METLDPKALWEKWPWKLQIERNSEGLVSHVRVLAAESRVVMASYCETTRDRVGRQIPKPGTMKTTKYVQPAVVCDCGIPYAGLSAETLLAHGDLLAAAPELYELVEEVANARNLHGRFLLDILPLEFKQRVLGVLAKARGEAGEPDPSHV
jgi:hypothetical protein